MKCKEFQKWLKKQGCTFEKVGERAGILLFCMAKNYSNADAWLKRIAYRNSRSG